MAYSADQTDRSLFAYFVKGEHTDGATEYPLESDQYTEYEDGYTFYAQVMFYFTDADGEEHTWDTEEKATEWLTANGYTSDY